MRITVEIPDKFMTTSEEEEMSGTMRTCTALMLFRTGKLSAGAACEFAGIDRYTFLQECAKRDIPVVRYDQDSLSREVAMLCEDGS